MTAQATSLRRWTLRILCGAALLLGLIVIALAALLGTQTGRDRLSAVASSSLAGVLRGSIHVGRIESLDPLALVAVDVEIKDAAGKRVAHAQRVEATLDLGRALDGALVFSRVVARGVTVSLREQDGTLAIADCFRLRTPSPSSGKAPLVVEIRAGRLEDGSADDLPGSLAARQTRGEFWLRYDGTFHLRTKAVSAELRHAGKSARLRAGQLVLALVRGEASRLSATLAVNQEELALQLSSSWSGATFDRAHATLSGRFGNGWLALLPLQTEGLALEEPLNIAISASANSARLALQGDAKMPASGAALSVSADCDGQRCQIRTSVQALRLDQLVRTSSTDPLGFAADLKLSGAGLHDFDLELQHAEYGKFRLPALQAKGQWSSRGLDVSQLQMNSWGVRSGMGSVAAHVDDAGRLQAKVEIGPSRLTADSRRGPLAQLQAERLQLRAKLAYDPANTHLSATAKLQTTRVAYQQLAAEQLELQLSAQGPLSAPVFTARAQAVTPSHGDVQLSDLLVTGQGTPSDLSLEAELGKGNARASAALRVQRRAQRVLLSGSGKIAHLFPEELRVESAELILRGGAVEISKLALSMGDARVTASGHYRPSGESSLLVRAEQICAGQLGSFGQLAAPWAQRLSGCAQGEAQLSGTPSQPNLKARVTASGVVIDQQQLGDVQAELQLAGAPREATIDVSLAGALGSASTHVVFPVPELSVEALRRVRYRGQLRASSELTRLAPLLGISAGKLAGVAVATELSSDGSSLRGSLVLSEGGRQLLQVGLVGDTDLSLGLLAARTHAGLQLDLNLQRFPLRLLDDNPLLAPGQVAGTVRIEQLLTSSPKLQLDLQLAGLRAADQPLPPIQLTGSADQNGLKLTARADDGAGHVSEFSGQLPWEYREPNKLVLHKAQAQASARFHALPISLLLAAVPQLSEPRGNLSGAISLRMVADQPALEGSLKLEAGSFTLQDPFVRVEQLSCTLELQPGLWRLRDLELGDQAGELHGSGELQLAGLSPVSAALRLTLRELPVRDEGITAAVVSAEISADARLNEQPRRVRVRLRKLAVALPEDEAGSLQPLQRHADVVYLDQPAQKADTHQQRSTPLEVEIDASEPFWIKRPGLSVELATKLNIHYREQLELSGVVQIRRGLLTLLGRGFALQRGTITFEGGPHIDPTVVLDAVHKLSDGHTVTASVRGTLSSPTLSFSTSVPGISTNAEALQLLATGRDNTAGEAAQAQVGAALAGLTTGLFSKVTASKYGKYVPVLSLESGASAGTRVRAGVQADSMIPKALRGVVQGAYVEGYVGRRNEGSSRTSAGGVLMELYFPHKLVTGGTWELPNNWAVEVTWEP